MDIAYFEEKRFLVLIDDYPKWVDIQVFDLSASALH